MNKRILTNDTRVEGKCERAHTTGRNQVSSSEKTELATHYGDVEWPRKLELLKKFKLQVGVEQNKWREAQ